jgi:hypothetical protein
LVVSVVVAFAELGCFTLRYTQAPFWQARKHFFFVDLLAFFSLSVIFPRLIRSDGFRLGYGIGVDARLLPQQALPK